MILRSGVQVVGLLLVLSLAGCRQDSIALVLTYSPPESTISIDGFVPVNAASPHTFKFFKAGRYRLRVEAPGYNTVDLFVDIRRGRPLEQTINLTPTGTGTPPPQLPPPPLIAISPDEPSGTPSCRVSVISEPAGALVSSGPATGGVLGLAGRSPIDIALNADQPTRLELSLEGFDTVRRIIPPASQHCPESLRVVLGRASSNVRTPGEPEPPPLVQPPQPPSQLVIPGDPQESMGLLSVTTEPWTIIYVDGRNLGASPLQGVSLAPGMHTVIMENRDLGKRRTKNINIRPGDHVRLAEEL